jgi:peptidoglycan hydrolase-like protein with peptidoglycan-binding domain
MLLPAAAFAQTNDVQSQIQSLMNQIHALQQQIVALLASSTVSGFSGINGSSTSMIPGMPGMPLIMPPGQMGKDMCVTLNRDLHVGSQGDDVKNLQQMLAQDPESGFSAPPTGVFGPMTAKAMMMFQTKNGIASQGTGMVGPMTRGFFERKCGKGLEDNKGSVDRQTGGMLTGTVSAVSGSSFTLQTRDGSKSVTVNVSASTTIEVFNASSTPPWSAGSMANIVVGKMAGVQGTPNADGSINAAHVKVGTPPPPPPMPPQTWMPKMNGQGNGGDHQGGQGNGTNGSY